MGYLTFLNISYQNSINTQFLSAQYLNNLIIVNLSSAFAQNILTEFISISNISSAIFDSLTISNISSIELSTIISSSSNVTINNSIFDSLVQDSILSFENCNLLISSSAFQNIIFVSSIISSTAGVSPTIFQSIFQNITGTMSLFYIISTNEFIVQSVQILLVNIFTVFYLDILNLNLNTDILIWGSIMTYIWRNEDTCILTKMQNAELAQNIFTSLYVNYYVTYANFYVTNFSSHNNNFTQTFMEINQGYCEFSYWSIIENFFPLTSAFEMLVSFGMQAIALVQNCYFESNGVIEHKSIYLAPTDNCIFSLWGLEYTSFRNLTAVITGKNELVSGVISAAPHGGIFELFDSTFIFLNTNPNFGYKGIYLDEFITATLLNNRFYNLLCNNLTLAHQHGGIYLSDSSNNDYSQNNFYVQIVNNSFYNCNCFYGGGLAVISIYMVDIENCSFFNSNSSEFGGSFILVAGIQSTLKNIVVNQSLAVEGSGLYFLNIFNIYVENMTLLDCVSSKSGVIFVDNINYLTILNCFSNNTISYLYGGYLYLISSVMNITNATILNSQSISTGGAIYVYQSSSLYLQNIFAQNTTSQTGGFMNLEDSSIISMIDSQIAYSTGVIGAVFMIKAVNNMTLMNILITDSSAVNGTGVLAVEMDDENALLNFMNITFERTYAIMGSAIFFLSSSLMMINNMNIITVGAYPLYISWPFQIEIFMDNVFIKNVIADSNLVSISGIVCEMSNWTFINNNVSLALIDFYTVDANILNFVISNNSNLEAFHLATSNVNLSYFSITNDKNYVNQLGFLDSVNSNLQISYGQLANLYSSLKYLIQSQSCQIQLVEVLFSQAGSQVLVATYSNLILNDCIFVNNTNDDTTLANDISFENSWIYSYYVILTNCSFDAYVGFSNKFSGLLNLNITNCSFINKDKLEFNKIYALDLLNLESIIINSSNFSSFSDSSIKIMTDYLFMRTRTIFNVSGCSFINNNSTLGSGIYSSGDVFLTLNSSLFLNNSAYKNKTETELQGMAPAIFYQPIDITNCKITIASSLFSNNKAEFVGSTVFSQIPIQTNSKNIFTNNQDFENFTSQMFSYPLDVNLISYSDVDNFENFTNSSNITIISGREFDLEMQIVDYFNQPINFDNSSIFTLKSEGSSSNSSIVIENGIITSKEGRLSFPNLVILTASDFNFTLSLEAEFIGLYKGIDSNLNIQSIQKSLYFWARECLPGEIILKDLTCQKCQNGFYSLVDPMVTPEKFQKCVLCPDNAYCYGGNFITPLAGFYRKDNESIDVTQCIAAKACLGTNDLPITNLTSDEQINGVCAEGNYGKLCFYCEKNYGKSDEGEFCQTCNEINTLVYGRIVLIAILLICYILLNSKFSEVDKKNNNYENSSVFLKIVINHSQHISILVSYLDYTLGGIEQFFNLSSYCSLSNDDVLNNDCLINGIYYNPEFLFVVKIITNNLLPVIFTLLSFIFWVVFSLKKHHYKSDDLFGIFKSKSTFFLVLSIFIFYPLMTTSCLNLLDCIHLNSTESVKYLKESPNIQCWDTEHLDFIIFICVPGIIFWGFAFPLFLFYVLSKNTNTLKSMAQQVSLKKEDDSLSHNGVSLKIQIEKKSTDTLENAANENAFKCQPFSKYSSKKSTSKQITETQRLSIIKRTKTFSFFYKGFSDKYYYWECMIFFRKFILIFFSTLNETDLDELKRLFLIGFLSVFYFITLSARPYKHRISNFMEMFSLLTCIFTVIVSVLTTSGISDSAKSAYFVLCIIMNTIFYLLAVSFISYDAYKSSHNLIKSKIKTIATKKMNQLEKQSTIHKNPQLENNNAFNIK